MPTVQIDPTALRAAFYDYLVTTAKKSTVTAYTYAARVARALEAGLAAGSVDGIENHFRGLPTTSRVQALTAWRVFVSWARAAKNLSLPEAPGVQLSRHGGRTPTVVHPRAELLAVAVWWLRYNYKPETFRWGEMYGWRTLPKVIQTDPRSWPVVTPPEAIQDLARWAWGWPEIEPPADAPVFVATPRGLERMSIKEIRGAVKSIGLSFDELHRSDPEGELATRSVLFKNVPEQVWGTLIRHIDREGQLTSHGALETLAERCGGWTIATGRRYQLGGAPVVDSAQKSEPSPVPVLGTSDSSGLADDGASH